jgi:hypothetical protein
MKNQKAMQAVVTTQEKLNPNQGSMLLSLFNEDGTPLVPGTGGSGGVVVPGDNMPNVADSLTFTNPGGESNWDSSPGPVSNGLFEKNADGYYAFTRTGLFSVEVYYQADNITELSARTSVKFEVGQSGYGGVLYKDVSGYSVGDSIPIGSMDTNSVIVSAAAGQIINLHTPGQDRLVADNAMVVSLFYPLLLIES